MKLRNPRPWNLADAVDEFLDAGFEDGDVVSHDWLLTTLEVPEVQRRKNPFLLLERMEAFKAALLEGHQIALQNVRGKGYRLVPPHDQARYAAEEAARYLSKGVRKAGRLLRYTRLDSLTDSERRRHTDAEVRVAALAGMVNKGQRDVFAVFDQRRTAGGGKE